MIFIPEYPVPNLPENIYDKIMYHKGLYCTKVWNQFSIFWGREIDNFLLTSMEILSLETQLWGWNTHTYHGLGL